MAHVLLVDDDKTTAALYRAALSKAGHTVTTAKNGTLGIAEAKKHRPGLIVMDLGMPEPNGFETMRLLKQDPDTKAIPVLALSGAKTAEDKDEAYEAGCAAYEVKPIAMKRLLDRVTELALRT